jgi:hypothetical protein
MSRRKAKQGTRKPSDGRKNLIPFSGVSDPRRGKGGGKKKEQMIGAWLKEYGQLTPDDLAKRCQGLARRWQGLKLQIPVFAIIAHKALLILAKQGRRLTLDDELLRIVLDRTEGRVKEELELSGKIGADEFGAVLARIYGPSRDK